MKHFILSAFFILTGTIMQAQETIRLYPGAVPNSKVSGNEQDDLVDSIGLIRKVITPALQVFLPEKEKASGTAVIICPGGGYSVLVYQGEGITTAKKLAAHGIAAFVLKYRLPDDATMLNKSIGPLQDAQQAVKIVRENAAKYGIDKHKVGIMGFSAGGHLASTEATHYKKAYIENDNGTNLRPDFQILVYPVISMQDSLTHKDSRRKLLGDNPSQEKIDEFSNEMHVDENTPPAYITHAGDDNLVDVDNSIFYFEQLRHHHVPAELHIYQKGGHGFVFHHKGWMIPLFQWMEESNWINYQ